LRPEAFFTSWPSPYALQNFLSLAPWLQRRKHLAVIMRTLLQQRV
jgi:hypothetical protein